MVNSYAFEVPAKYVAELASGEIVRFGALLKDSVSGQVVAHLQETGVFQQVLSHASVLPFSPVSALTAVSSVGANFQLHQLTTLVQTLQMLQVATLGLSIAGIGVSVIGFAVMNKKLNGLSDQISSLRAQVERGFNELRERELRSHFSKLRGLFDQADQAHTLSNPAAEWLRISHLLAEEGAFLRGELAHYQDTPVFEPDLFLALTTSYGLCNAGRIQCLLLARELRTAHRVSEDNASDGNALFDRLKPIQLARNMNSEQLFEGKRVGMDVDMRLRTMQRFVGNVRDIQDGMNSKPYLIETLISKKMDGSEYLIQLRQQKSEPLLLMQAN
jgi:hypothetical protein